MTKLIIPLNEAVAEKYSDFFFALGNQQRDNIIQQLKQGQQHSVNKLAVLTNIPFNRISEHLGKLRKVKILLDKKEGRNTYYSLNQYYIKEVFIRFLASFSLSLLEKDEILEHTIDPSLQIKLLRILGSENRCHILKLLNNKNMPLTEIQKNSYLEQQTISDHVHILINTRIIDFHKSGRYNICQLNRSVLVLLFSMFWKNYA